MLPVGLQLDPEFEAETLVGIALDPFFERLEGVVDVVQSEGLEKCLLGVYIYPMWQD